MKLSWMRDTRGIEVERFVNDKKIKIFSTREKEILYIKFLYNIR